MRIRLIAAAAAVTALFALAACRSAPNVAAYVGETTITEQQVTDLMDGYNAVAPADRKIGREIVVQYAVGEQLCDRASKAKGFSYQPSQIPNESVPFIGMASRFEGCLEAIPVTPASEAELRTVYDSEVASGRLSPDTKFEAVRGSLQGNENLQRQLSWKRMLDEQAKAADVNINPRYTDPFGVSVSNAVVDRPIAPQQ